MDAYDPMSSEADDVTTNTPTIATSALAMREQNQLHAPILRLLPQELLRIILFLAAPQQRNRSRERAHSRPISWLYLGHVCNALRQTLLGLRQLWAEVICLYDRLDVTQELVRRATGAPLAIVIPHDSASDELVDYLMAHFGQARIIEASSAKHLPRILQNLNGSNLPLLKRLSLDSGHAFANAQVRSVALRSFEQTSTAMFSMVTPHLESIDLRNVYVPIAPYCLRELCIFLEVPAASRWAEHLLDALRQCTLLYSLDVRFLNSVPTTTDTRTIHFPNIRYLYLRGIGAGVAWFWSRIVVRRSTLVTAMFDDNTPFEPVMWESLSALASHVHRARDAYSISGFTFLPDLLGYDLRIRVYIPYTGYTYNEIGEHSFNSLSRDHCCIFSIELEIYGLKPDDLHGYLMRMRDIFGMSGVKHLNLAGLEDRDMMRDDDEEEEEEEFTIRGVGEGFSGYPKWFSAFGAVRDLSLCYNPFPACIYLASTDPDNHILFPRLRTLALLGLSLRETHLDDIVRMVERRASSGAPLQQLKVAFAVMNTPGAMEDFASQSFRTRLQELVPSVTFGFSAEDEDYATF